MRPRFLAGIAASCLAAGAAYATDVTVVGLFTGKAVVQIDGGGMRTLSVGQKTPEGVTLIAVDGNGATFEIDGKRTTLGMGQARIARGEPTVESAKLVADLRGHFAADGQVNGRSVRFMVDTGATTVALPSTEADRMAVDYKKGQRIMLRTANGVAAGYLVKLDTVSVGAVTLHGVEAVVVEGGGLALPLLGMSFLNRMNMTREGDIMTLTKRY